MDDGYGRGFAPVGQFLPNAWGIHDMLGNLAELCCSYYTDSLPGGANPVDLTLPDERSARRLISRGGAWCSPADYLHAAWRNEFTGAQTPHIGLRLVIRQGERIARSRGEITAAIKLAKQKAKEEKKP